MPEEVKPNGKFQFREKVVAMLCLTFISITSMFMLADPENIVINVIVAIAAFVSGVAAGRKTDDVK